MSKVYVPPDITQTEHRGTLDRVVFSDDSQPFVIAALTDGASVCGPALADSLARGVIYRFLGAWTPDPKYGYRFRFSTFLVHAASSKAGVAKYLESICDGFPKRLFNKLWAAYGDESITRLRDDPVSVAVDISAPPELCSEASDALKRDRRYADTKVTLFQLLDKRGFPSRIYSELLDAWGDTAPDRIRANPFDMLGKFSGAGFRRCDRLWSDLGLPKDSLARGVACASHLLLDGGGAGHTWLSAVSLAERLREVAPGCDPVETFKAAIDQGKVKKHRDAAGELWLAAYPRAAAEERIAASVARLTAHGPTVWPTDRVWVGPAGKPS
jgi:exodeoxyribonuclease V alpha subunit